MNTEQKPEAIHLAGNITASGHTEREAFEAWWRENVSQGLAEIDHDYRYWALWQARAAFSVDHIAQNRKMAAPVVWPEPAGRLITGPHGLFVSYNSLIAATPGNLYTRAQVEAMLEAQGVKL